MNERQTQIAHAALSLFLKEGVGISTARIAKAAGVSNGTLFNAFPTKQALIDASYVMVKTNLSEALTPPNPAHSLRETMRQFWTDYISWARENPTQHKAKHLLLESGLASEEARAQGDAVLAPFATAFQTAYEAAEMIGPNLMFIGDLGLRFVDLTIDHNLSDADEKLAFAMFCNALSIH